MPTYPIGQNATKPGLPRPRHPDRRTTAGTGRTAHPREQRPHPTGARPARHRRHRRLTMPFTRNALIRAIRTAAQTAIGAIGAATLVAQKEKIE